MQKTVVLILLIGLAIGVLTSDTTAQDTQDWHLRNLPEGVQARLGKGSITGNFALSNDGKRLAVACSIGIWMYDAEMDKALDLLTGHTNWVSSVAFSPDGSLLASGSDDKTVRVWDVSTSTELWTRHEHNGRTTDVVFSPDGKTLASASEDYTIRLWDVRTGTHLRKLTGRHIRGVSQV